MPTHPPSTSLRKVFNYTEIKTEKLMGHQAANQQENKPINYTFGSTHAVGFSETPFYVIFMREKWWNGGKDLYHLSVFIWVEMVGGVGKREKGHLKDCFRWNPFPSSFAALCRKTYEKKNCFMAFLSSLHLFFFCFRFRFYFFRSYQYLL